ncbi:hypothetical protein [Sporisorium scitamineum]|uniref:Tetrahydrofolylpolyglutamate synthase n=1 Tax=Sporisorium scitamineum TaxID=49012 RepID=A0A0F7S8R4_9BASI|nr:hypothetical protein [Sporisorium scitamineum]
MPSADPKKALPGGGPASLITLKTHPPLPAFSIPYRVPDPSSDISSFKLSILRILTGQTNAQSSTKPLTFSEEVKEKAINGWKMQMLTLELRQKDDLEEQDYNEDAQPDGDDESSTEMRGFGLQDHHECSLIEEGDMIVVRLKPGHTLQELELPKLGSDHRYSAPAGSLTRAGTLSEPPPYSIIQPSEPSSFSSSVGAQPNANYHQHRYQDYRSAFRVVTTNNVGSGHVRRTTANNTTYAGNPAGLGQGLNLLQSSSGKGSGSKGKRRSSASAALPKASASPKLGSTVVLPSTTPPTGATPATSSSINPNTAALATSTIDQQNVSSPPTSPRLGSNTATPVSASGPPEAPLRRNSSSVITVQAGQRATAPAAAASSSPPNPNGKSSAQFPAMPATALVIGPGVQGQVGRNPASVTSPIGSYGGAEISEYGNAKGLVGFTSAGGSDLRAKPRRRPSKQNSQEHISTDSNVLDTGASRLRPSNPASAAADAAERRAALARQASGEVAYNGASDVARRPAKERQTSSSRISKSELPSPPVLPPIQNLAPFPEFEAATAASKPRKERDLPAMHMAADEPETSKSMVAVSAATESKPPRLSFLRKFSSNTQARRNKDSGADSPAQESTRGGGFGFTRQQPQTTSVPLDEMDLAIKPALDGEVSQNNSLTRAERRYLERLYSGKTDESGGSASKAPTKTPAAAVPATQQELGSSTHEGQAAAAVVLPVTASSTNGTPSGSASQPVSGGLTASSNGNGHGNGSGMGQRIELGLERIPRLLARLGSPHKRFPVIHVAGTNGKGSTIAYLDSILRNALDIRTGTFVSPHLIERRDCCKVDGEVVARDVWRQAQSDVLFADQGLDIAATADDDGQPLKSSPFELLTAQTFQAFSLLDGARKPEVLLVEVGLGGRLDATNVFDSSQVLASLVCPIDRDHEAFLGSKLEGIAREKAGIVKENGLCVIADQRLEDGGTVDQLALGPLENEAKQLGARAAGILDSVRNVCMARNARLIKTYIPWKLLSLPATRSERWGSSIDFTPRLAPTLFFSTSGLNPPSTFVAHPHDPVMFSVPVSVERTRANLTGVCMAVQTLSSIARDEWAQDRWEELRTRIMWGLRDDPEANLRVREAINAVQWAGRCSWHKVDGKDVLVDGAHNESSALALREYVDGCLAARALSVPDGKGKSKSKVGTQQFEVTYIFAFSEGKDYEAMVHALLDRPGALVERQNVALTTFSPPEGMPWVRSVELADSLATLKRVTQTVDVGELRTFDCVDGAMEWAKLTKGPVVVAGSLYLVADTYRWLLKKGVWSQ